jgi:hypothetical protein
MQTQLVFRLLPNMVYQCLSPGLHCPTSDWQKLIKYEQKTWCYYYHVHFISPFLLLWGPFAKFVDSPYYSKLELCGGAVTVSFSKYLPWQVMHFLQHSTHFSKMCCRPLITSKFLASEFPFCGWKSPEIAWDEIWNEFCVWLGKSRSVEPYY